MELWVRGREVASQVPIGDPAVTKVTGRARARLHRMAPLAVRSGVACSRREAGAA